MELHSSPFATNIRYNLAKQQLDQLFLKWISQSTTTTLLQSLIGQTKNPTIALLVRIL